MPRPDTVLVDVVRDFLAAQRLMARLFSRYRKGELKFEELEELIGDDESSALYRLKERCHAAFRPKPGASAVSMRREVLFDLVVGSLFHEAMKFRENFYQREVYGPRVRALRSESGEDASTLFREFERILAAVSERLEEGLQENENLIRQTGEQLRVLLAEHRSNGFIVRYLIENRELVEEVFCDTLEQLLSEIRGDTAAGFALAGRSYLDSGYYESAASAFVTAISHGGKPAELAHLCAYARGMAAYLARDYGECLAQLGAWIEGRGAGEENLSHIAYAAVSKIDQLVQGEDCKGITKAAAALLERIRPADPAASPTS